jgi:hypothetical protein
LFFLAEHWGPLAAPDEATINHARIVSDRLAIFDNFPGSMRNWSDKFKFPRDDGLGKVTFANKVWYDVNIIAFDHPENFSKARLFFQKP